MPPNQGAAGRRSRAQLNLLALPLLVVGGIVIVVLAATVIDGAQRTAGWGFDFSAYYQGALRFIGTGSPYLAETLYGPFQPGAAGLYLYSPVPALVIAPLTWLGTANATLVWLFLRLGLLFAACVLMPVPRWVKLASLGVAVISAPFLYDLNLGNVSLIVTFFAVVAWRWLDEPVGALAIAASLTIRPTMAIIGVWWALRRKWRAVAWLAIGGVAIFVVTLPFIGVAPWLQYANLLRNVSDTTAVSRNLDLAATALSLGVPANMTDLFLLGGYVLAVAAILLSLRRDREIGFAVTLMASLLLAPLLWDHYLTNLIVPGALLAARGRRVGVLLPLLGWLPLVMLPFVVILGMLLPFTVPDRGQAALDLSPVEAEPIADVDAGLSGAAGG